MSNISNSNTALFLILRVCSTVLVFNSFLEWLTRTAPISALRKLIGIGTVPFNRKNL